MPAKSAASHEQRTSLDQLLKAVEVAHEIEEVSPGRHGNRHEASDSQRLVAHDHVLAQSRFKRRGVSKQKTASRSDEARDVSSRESLWSRTSTLPGVGFHSTSRCDDAATFENQNVSLIPARTVRRNAPVAIELPSVSLPFLHSARRASATPEDCRESPCRDDLFRGHNRSIEDLADMVAWLDN